jgi:hypothetical protein
MIMQSPAEPVVRLDFGLGFFYVLFPQTLSFRIEQDENSSLYRILRESAPMSDWQDDILKEFSPGVRAISVVADLDGLLTECWFS